MRRGSAKRGALARWAGFAPLLLAVAGCAAPRIPYTDAEAARAETVVPGARTWADYPNAAFERRASEAVARNGRAPAYLSLSGGGGDGAYGAGILNGWTRSGQRPVFAIVSGVSTGALLAPFAFLGPAYDGTIRELYTSGVAESLLADPNLVNAVFGASVFSDERLRTLVSRYVTPELVAEVARQSAGGRLLLVLTTNLDSKRPVIWDMGEIARRGTPEAVTLFRDVMIASASIPAVFPPVLIEAEADGRRFEEMHVDGSVASNVFTLPRSYLAASGANRASVRGGRIFVVLNTSPLPDFAVTENRATAVVGRTISLALGQQVRNDLRATFDASARLGFAFNVTYIEPNDLGGASSSEGQIGFDTARMRRLYAIGEARGRTGTFWKRKPPSVLDLAAAR